MSGSAITDLIQRLSEDTEQRLDRQRDIENSIRDFDLRLDAEINRLNRRIAAFEQEQRETMATLLRAVSGLTQSVRGKSKPS